MGNRRRIKLPAITEEYLKIPGTTKTGKFVRSLHRWLEDHDLSLQDATPSHITEFIGKVNSEIQITRAIDIM